MMIYFVKEYTNGVYGRSVGIGYLDTDKPIAENEYLAQLISFECDKDFGKVERCKDYITTQELAGLTRITVQQYEAMVQGFNASLEAITKVVNEGEKRVIKG